MVEVKFYDNIADELLKFAVIISKQTTSGYSVNTKKERLMKCQAVTENLEKVFLKQPKENYKKKQGQLILKLNQYVCILLKERHE